MEPARSGDRTRSGTKSIEGALSVAVTIKVVISPPSGEPSYSYVLCFWQEIQC